MTYKYITDESAEVFPVFDGISKPVLLNTHKLKFMLIHSPSMDEIAEAIEQHALIRLEDRWLELMVSNVTGYKIQALNVKHPLAKTLPTNLVYELLGVSGIKTAERRLKLLSLDEQRLLVSRLKPSTVPEMLALYQDTANIDQTGYRYLCYELTKARSAIDFFESILANLFSDIVLTDYTLGSPKIGKHQPRILELLGLAAKKGWLLFPFITGESGINEMRALMHRENARRYLNPLYGPQEFKTLEESLQELSPSAGTYTGLIKYAKYLIICSTFRTVAQASNSLFSRCTELVDNGKPDSHRQVGYARRCYNAMLMLHNSQHPNSERQLDLKSHRPTVSLDDFVSIKDAVTHHPHLTPWTETMSAFIRANVNSAASGKVRRSCCIDFIEFLTELKSPPLCPEDSLRHLINDYSETGQTYRNYLRIHYTSVDSRNSKLSELHQFFAFVQDQLRAKHTMKDQSAVWFSNPIDLKFDRFATHLKSGTTRKSIAADIMKEMRQLLVADDYAWPKQWDSDWTNLVNQSTKKLEYVWCPSAALCLYTLLSLPLRSLQARILDSGEADAYVFDFDTGTMIPNPNQLPVNNRLDPSRSEGFIQVLPSGLSADPELVGMWINVNKTSDHGYAIPWVSDDLRCHLRYQREWISMYATHPNMQTIEDAQGYRNTPQEWLDTSRSFYCLFRDPTVLDRVPDKSLPVSKQKLMRLWGRLSLEVQNRINARAVNEVQRVRLVKPGTESNVYPVASHDIHSLRVSGITDLLDRGVPLNIVSEYVAGHATYIMTLWYDTPSPGAVRRAMIQAQERAGESLGPIPRLLESEIDEIKPYLISHPDFQGGYTGFDALQDNVGLIQVRHSGICPGTRCEDGGLTENGRIKPVPVGDRGPSCPQCRFWMTGPAFLLGQVIEGNQLILKIRSKVASLATSRAKIMDAEDAGDVRLADLLRAKNDIEERQLNNMLTEWWHRMRFYESSLGKLDAYQQARDGTETGKGESIVLFKHHDEAKVRFGFGSASELELKHFLSTCAEILPSFTDEALSAHQDIELAVGKFLAINDEAELSAMFFKLDDSQRLTAANLTIELMLRSTASPLDVTSLLEGKIQLKTLTHLQSDLKTLLTTQITPAVLRTRVKLNAEGSHDR
jgi:Putative phage integrase